MAEIVPDIDGPGAKLDCLLNPYDASALFEPYTERRVRLRLDPRLAELPLDAEADRVRLVLRGFARLGQVLATQGRSPWSFGMIGPGSGAEVIGAAHILPSLRRIAVADRDPLILTEAASNIRRHVDATVEVTSLEGSVFAPLAGTGRRVDLLYVNLANIPFTAAPEAVLDHTAYCPPVKRTAHDELLNTYRLALPFHFLHAAPATLTARGAALLLLSGRFPYGVFARLADAGGFRFEEIACGLQRQTDTRTVLTGCAAAEMQGEEFDFYDYDAATAGLAARAPGSGAALKSLLTPHRLSARAALRTYPTGKSIGHTLHLMLATPIRAADPAVKAD
jgi:hypothetical protein